MTRCIIDIDTNKSFHSALQWTQLPGSAVDVSAKGNELWMTSIHQSVFRWTGSSWQFTIGSAKRVAASPDGWTWLVNNKDAVYRWNVHQNGYELMDIQLVQISAISKDLGRCHRLNKSARNQIVPLHSK